MFYLLSLLLAALAAALWTLWKITTTPHHPLCAACREPTPAAQLEQGVCWVCARNMAPLIVLGMDAPASAPADEATVPAWLEAAVNAAGDRQ